MNITFRPSASLATETFDAETLQLLDSIEVELPDFGDIDLDAAFGTPLEMYEADELPHERWAGIDMAVTLGALKDRYARMDAARDIAADDPTIARRVRERLIDVLLPYATQLRTAPSATVTKPLPLAA
ncbi:MULTISPECIES: hypothetical protein [unclassified Streptomyces]|uniref:hypothetical protein n=1 Tax=unclassified Streptomyces TaxID=2593676 RepID=UPI00081B0347|nr:MULTISPECIES: hypothetical protein [unclassified Streptomyces]MYQ82700.1 hypothetical protein [Streptomyces sp. SID4936]SCD50969.1 hypothetical protein GA0115234_101917 [Streptomyces sp. DvalAA-43]